MGQLANRKAATAALVLTAAAAALLLSGCGGDQPEVRPAGREVRAQVVEVQPQAVPDYLPATGHLESTQVVQVSTRMMGWVEKLHVDVGDRVDRGDPLIGIDDTDMQAKRAQVEAGISEAEAMLANARVMAERFRSLYEEKSVSKQQLDDVETQLKRAEAGLASARAMRREIEVQIGYLLIEAPIAGVVTRRMIEEGNMASPGHPLLTLEQNDRMKAIARVGERDIGSIAVGDSVIVEVTSLPGARYPTTIDKVVLTADPGSRTYDVEARVANPAGRLKSGMFARVLVPIAHRRTILVPPEGVIERGQLRGVWVVDADGVAGLRWVRLGRRFPGGYEVLSGLDAGERIVLRPEQPLVEGDRVVS